MLDLAHPFPTSGWPEYGEHVRVSTDHLRPGRAPEPADNQLKPRAGRLAGAVREPCYSASSPTPCDPSAPSKGSGPARRVPGLASDCPTPGKSRLSCVKRWPLRWYLSGADAAGAPGVHMPARHRNRQRISAEIRVPVRSALLLLGLSRYGRAPVLAHQPAGLPHSVHINRGSAVRVLRVTALDMFWSQIAHLPIGN